jgi:citronellol/citronellal dehydrogenase
MQPASGQRGMRAPSNRFPGDFAMSLKDKTLFITGASRGIGLAIALRAAKDGANIAIAAKTAEPHKRLPGTIYTAADAIEQAGGRALPLLCDIRFEEQVAAAVDATVKRFGGIDICVNNASAISLTGTEATEMKRWDLMHQINARGTFMVSKTCIPHLKRSDNPHVLMLSPPLDMSPRWFAPHVAYTMAKYGMSLCVLGMAEEFRNDGIAFNALWPRTAIATAAVEYALGGEDMMKASRTPEILADAAYLIFGKPARAFTGHFLIDDTFLWENGTTEFERYRVDPSRKLAPDFFVPDAFRAPPGVADTIASGLFGS